MNPVICNSGPLMVLAKLNRLDFSPTLFEQVLVPRTVYNEVVIHGLSLGYSDAQTVKLFFERLNWQPVDVSVTIRSHYSSASILDPGETDVLALALETAAPLILLDDEAARNEARRLGLKVKGSLGVLVSVYQADLINYEQIEIMLFEIANRPDIWINKKLCLQVLTSLAKK